MGRLVRTAGAALRIVIGAACLGAFATSAARAQDAFAPSRVGVQLFLPTPTPGTTFTIDRPGVPRHMTLVIGGAGSYASRPFVLAEDGRERDVLVQLTQLEFLAGIGFFERLELGIALPLVIAEGLPIAQVDAGGTGVAAFTSLGDARLALKVPLLRGDFAVSARAVATLPTAKRDQFAGESTWTLTPGAVFAYRTGALTLGGELAWQFRRRAEIAGVQHDDELEIALGAAFEVVRDVSLIVETRAQLGLAADDILRRQSPMDWHAGVRTALTRGISAEVGAGGAYFFNADGHDAVGVPAFRLFGAVRFATEREPCRFGPEDDDGFEDGDFCAEPDNDRDTLPDELDQCPNDAEDVDGFRDDDGCPDSDNDADGVPDGSDLAPLESEDRDGFEDQDGRPEADNDGDGIADGLDECPMEPEDLDSFQDEDGCPEPGPRQAVVTVTDTRILVSERIYFDFDRDTIRAVSMPLLDQVAEVILAEPADRRIRIEGYTDNAGLDQYNVDLSYRRARAVREYLVGRGVPGPRLDYVGYGAAHPVAPNDTPEGRALNRRVEFTFLEPAAAPTPSPTPPRPRRR